MGEELPVVAGSVVYSQNPVQSITSYIDTEALL